MLTRQTSMRYSAILLIAIAQAFSDTPNQSARVEHQVGDRVFQLPAGFSIELVTDRKQVARPVVADLDEQGRLYVVDSSGDNARPTEQLKKPRHRVVQLTDADGDGVYEKQTVFADKLGFSEGAMWHRGSLYVAAPPVIWKLTDRNGDGVADDRQVWFDGKTVGGCGNDLHGPYRGPDGRIYWCKGGFEEQHYETNGKKWKTRASHVFRAKPDGSALEAVMTGGMDNPVDVVFTPTGEPIFSCTFLVHPGGGLRDGLIYAQYGGLWGKDHPPIRAFPQTGELMPELLHLGPAAPSGLHFYQASQDQRLPNGLGSDFDRNLFCCQFNLRKVSRHRFQPTQTAGHKVSNEVFLTSSSIDFHPTDVIQDADGSLLVIDTGGWYTMCCPSSQLTKPDILGGIYRIRPTGNAKSTLALRQAALGHDLAWDNQDPQSLVERLRDDRWLVRRRAVDLLAQSESATVVKAMSKWLDRKVAGNRDGMHQASVSAVDARAKIAMLSVLAEIETEESRSLIRQQIDHPNRQLAEFAIKLLGISRDRQAGKLITEFMTRPHVALAPSTLRVCVESLGRIGGEDAKKAIERLTGSMTTGGALMDANRDRHLVHAIIYAMIEMGDTHHLADNTRWPGTIVALSQMGDSKSAVKHALTWINSPHEVFRDQALWVIRRHPEHAELLVDFVRTLVTQQQPDSHDQSQTIDLLARLASNATIQALLAKLYQQSDSSAQRQLIEQSLLRSEVDQLSPSLKPIIIKLLSSKTLQTDQVAFQLLEKMPVPENTQAADLIGQLTQRARDEHETAVTRLSALKSLPGKNRSLTKQDFPLVLTHLCQSSSNERSLALQVMSQSKLSKQQQLALIDKFSEVATNELDRLLNPFDNLTDAEVGRALIAGLAKSPALLTLRVDAIKSRLTKLPADVQAQANPLYARFQVDLSKMKARLDQLLPVIEKGGDIRRGQAIFQSQKGQCQACHAIGYVGGKIGPDLTRIGAIRSKADLLESIVYPSSSLVRSYEPVMIETQAGENLNGVIKEETNSTIVLIKSATETIRLNRSDIVNMRASNTSIMPSGFDQQLSPSELADLIEFLKSRQ